MKRLRVMHVVYCMGTGGTEMALRKLVTGLDPQRFENIICTVAPLTNVERVPGVRFVSLDRSGRPGFLVPQLTKLFLRERPDVVHSRSWGAIEAVPAAKLARVPRVIHSEHGRDINTMHGDPWRRRVLRRFCYAIADNVFAVSNELRDHYAQQLKISASRIEVIPNGVDATRFRPAPSDTRLRMLLGLSDDVIVLGTVGRLDPVKDHRTLLHAAETLAQAGTPVQVVMVGEGPEAKRLQAVVNDSPWLRDRVTFAGESASPENWLNSFDIYVLPSLSEGMSNSLLEAMSTGLPCVATRVGSNADLVEDGRSGFLVPAGDAAALACSLAKLAASKKLRLQFGEHARNKADAQFSLRSMIENYTRLYAVNKKEAGTAQVVLGGVKG